MMTSSNSTSLMPSTIGCRLFGASRCLSTLSARDAREIRRTERARSVCRRTVAPPGDTFSRLRNCISSFQTRKFPFKLSTRHSAESFAGKKLDSRVQQLQQLAPDLRQDDVGFEPDRSLSDASRQQKVSFQRGC